MQAWLCTWTIKALGSRDGGELSRRVPELCATRFIFPSYPVNNRQFSSSISNRLCQKRRQKESDNVAQDASLADSKQQRDWTLLLPTPIYLVYSLAEDRALSRRWGFHLICFKMKNYTPTFLQNLKYFISLTQHLQMICLSSGRQYVPMDWSCLLLHLKNPPKKEKISLILTRRVREKSQIEPKLWVASRIAICTCCMKHSGSGFWTVP